MSKSKDTLKCRKQEDVSKMVKHMNGFKEILDYQKENELISAAAYGALYDVTETLIEKWE
ncbi:FIMAH domain-containing protein [Virgibacillus saliphilus]|uniref:FIMAH domain-containing protein n=1 Tax=Virgibacillus saliphilus TaxID=2831674 RepID=UPI0035CCCC57